MAWILGIALVVAGESGARNQKDLGAAERALAQGQMAFQKRRYKEAVRHLDMALKGGAEEA